MSNSLQEKFKKMHPNDRQVVEEQRNALKEQLEIIKNDQSGGVAQTLDSAVLRRQLDKKERDLDQDEKLIAKGVQKDKLAREAKQLEEELRSEMCSRNELWQRSGTMDSEKAVAKQMAFEQKHGDKARRWQEIQSRLEPNDPMNCSMERIRPER